MTSETRSRLRSVETRCMAETPRSVGDGAIRSLLAEPPVDGATYLELLCRRPTATLWRHHSPRLLLCLELGRILLGRQVKDGVHLKDLQVGQVAEQLEG